MAEYSARVKPSNMELIAAGAAQDGSNISYFEIAYSTIPLPTLNRYSENLFH
jgi:hypothetical protein